MLRPSQDSDRQHASRRAWAVVAAVLWVLGFDVGPGVHLAFHDAFGSHRHAGDRGGVHADDHDHDHEHADVDEHAAALPLGVRVEVHEHHDDVEPIELDDTHLASTSAVDGGAHGRHSLEHRGIAVQTPPPAFPAIGSAPWTAAPRSDAAHDPVRSARPVTTRVRGPPSQHANV